MEWCENDLAELAVQMLWMTNKLFQWEARSVELDKQHENNTEQDGINPVAG